MHSSAIVRFTVAAALVVGAATRAFAQPAETPRPEPRRMVSARGFSVVLVLGDMQSGSTENVPPAARKALSDMKDFLPYRGYRLLDAQWILGSQNSTSRLRGTDDQEYQLTLRGAPMGGRMHVIFQLREPGADSVGFLTSADARSRFGKLPALRDQLTQIQAAAVRERAKTTESAPSVERLNEEAARVRQQIAELESAVQAQMPAARGRSVIDTSFSMDVGETVVVGTSRVRGGDKALIALLTAVAGANNQKKE